MKRSPIPKERLERVVKEIIDKCDNEHKKAVKPKTFAEIFPKWWKLTKELVFADLLDK